MRLWIFSIFIIISQSAWAQSDSIVSNTDSIASRHEAEQIEKIERYEQRLARYQHFFQSLTPDFIRFQYAGSTGLFNLGCGWEHGKRKKFETDIMLGYVPKYDKESPFFTFTIRETYVPWTKPLNGEAFTFQPLSCGIFLNSVLSSEYWTREPDRYPGTSYYRFSSKIRAHIFIGQRYSMNIPKHKRYLSRQVSAVWELSTCDLYLISKIPNATLPWHEILSLSLGLKYNF